jgi:hypothetical protein
MHETSVVAGQPVRSDFATRIACGKAILALQPAFATSRVRILWLRQQLLPEKFSQPTAARMGRRSGRQRCGAAAKTGDLI